jgi:hypothetical protein
LNQVGSKFIKYTYEDNRDYGFYIVACKSYDRRITIYHTHRPELKIKLTRNVEDGHLFFFDMNVSRLNSDDEDVELWSY